MTKTPREIIKILKKQGFVKKSQNGSHLKMYNPITNVTIPVLIHSKEIKKD
ncbi:type II toxin-antitoxin system HicA family toxin [Lactobacillus laiwuensis]|uniref:type II toxin-antitoxin system HicA family toxin n=1 Tax=Lactobacillus laiwuensis TaxID=2841034 RepID=UPI00283A8DFE|nr:type II toxin-antitoxin system HicA family toxin [Lactobacillus laiwuensis]